MPVGALPTLLVFNTEAAADALVALFAALETPDEPVDVETPPDDEPEIDGVETFGIVTDGAEMFGMVGALGKNGIALYARIKVFMPEIARFTTVVIALATDPITSTTPAATLPTTTIAPANAPVRIGTT